MPAVDTVGIGFKRSRQIFPPVSMLGWYTGVMKVMFGASNGYLDDLYMIIGYLYYLAGKARLKDNLDG